MTLPAPGRESTWYVQVIKGGVIMIAPIQMQVLPIPLWMSSMSLQLGLALDMPGIYIRICSGMPFRISIRFLARPIAIMLLSLYHGSEGCY